jgi:hypothetical protein
VGTIASCEANGKIQKIENIDNLVEYYISAVYL